MWNNEYTFLAYLGLPTMMATNIMVIKRTYNDTMGYIYNQQMPYSDNNDLRSRRRVMPIVGVPRNGWTRAVPN
jgi:hypothetical protein